MIRFFLNRMLVSFSKRYQYDVGYQQDILNRSIWAFIKFMGFQTMAGHCGQVPVEALYAARIRAILWEDCGPCTQLAVNMGLEAGVNSDVIRAIVYNDVESLPYNAGLVVRFAEFVLIRSPEAEQLGEEIRALWGEAGLHTIAFAISSYRVYPTIKYALGYGKTCSRVMIDEVAVTPSSVLHQPKDEAT